MTSLNKNFLIATCRMNCMVCRAYLREKNKCPGCRGDDTNKPVTGIQCKTCEVFKNGKLEFCFQCEDVPCKSLKHLDKRYRIRYNMSMIENLEYIKNHGVEEFLENEEVRWTCPECGGTICVHTGRCYNCGKT